MQGMRVRLSGDEIVDEERKLTDGCTYVLGEVVGNQSPLQLHAWHF